MERLYCLGGMPRAGSTLLCNVLAQNPDLHATHTSGMMDVMFGVRNNWNKLIEHKAHAMDEAQMRVLRAIPEAYYADIEKPVVIDKCRGWISLIEMYEAVFGQPMKVIVPVRDLRDIIASFEKLWRKNAEYGQVPGETDKYAQFQTVEGRCAHWCEPMQPVGLAFNRITDALARGLADRMHFVDFDELTRHPSEVLEGIYDFLDLPKFAGHNFDNVEQVTTEDDSVHGFKNLHNIRPAIRPVKPSFPEILGNVAEKYAENARFWEIK